ncbi:MAG: 4Fe-4S dicluster domain-containing protein [Moorella humiferrea]|nr:4Fe-4S dicluster domain-containing protein [Moorella humiferrea]
MRQYAFYLDLNRCVGCQACAVACMDQNDLLLDQGQPAWRRVFTVEDEEAGKIKITYVTMACMHCHDAPCIMACPTGAIHREGRGTAVLVNSSLCIGCHSCAMACPFGVPRFGLDGKMQKCRLCIERVEVGLEPACVLTCPTRALKFGPVNEITVQIQTRAASKLARAVSL